MNIPQLSTVGWTRGLGKSLFMPKHCELKTWTRLAHLQSKGLKMDERLELALPGERGETRGDEETVMLKRGPGVELEASQLCACLLCRSGSCARHRSGGVCLSVLFCIHKALVDL